MKKVKKIQLKPVDWKTGSVPDFLHLNPNEVAFIEMKLALARSIRSKRLLRKLTQSELARLIDSSQSRVAKMESADFSVSLDLLIRVLLVLGASRKEVANVIALESKHAA